MRCYCVGDLDGGKEVSYLASLVGLYFAWMLIREVMPVKRVNWGEAARSLTGW